MGAARLLSVFSLLLTTIPVAYFDISAVSIAEGIHFVSPGQGSELTSPIHLVAELPIMNGAVRVDLHGRERQLLIRRLLAPTESGRLELDLPFEISTDSEAATLLISIEDEYERMQEVASIEMTLLAEGVSVVKSGKGSRIVIESPATGETVEGGTVTVSGNVSGLDTGLLLVQLITRSGRVLASQDVFAILDDSGNGAFVLELDYAVRNGEWTRLSVARRQGGITVLLQSVEILFSP